MARTTSAPPSATPISLAALKQAADGLKKAAVAANTDGDIELTRREIKAFSPRTPDAAAIRKALNTFAGYTSRSSGPQLLSTINHRIGNTYWKADDADRAGPPQTSANGLIDAGREYDSLKDVPEFRALAALVKPSR